MKTIRTTLITMLAAATLLPAQELSPETKADLETLLSLRATISMRAAQAEFGKAFNPDIALSVYRDVLVSDQLVEDLDSSDCPTMAALANGAIRRFSGDYDAESVVARVRDFMAMDQEALEKVTEKTHELYKRLDQGYRPVLEARERKREVELVRLHATEPGVATLSNGILVSVTPGEADIRDITRGTTETGVRTYTRITNDMEFEDLPETVRLVADEIPKGSAWVIWVPAEVENKLVADRKKAAQDENQARIAKLAKLAPGVTPPPAPQPEKAAGEEEEPMKHLLRLHVWKENPDAPVKVLPDVRESIL